MSDVNANGTIAQEVTLLDKDGNQIDSSHPLSMSASELPLPSGAATSAKQDTLLTELEKKADATETQPVRLIMDSTVGTLGELDATLAIDCHTCSVGTLVFEVSGTWKGKIVVEGAVNGTYNNLSIVQPGGTISFAGVNNDNQNGVYRALIIAGYTVVRLRMSSYTSGTATINMNAAELVPTAFVWQLNQANLLGTMYQGGTWSNQIATGAVIATVEARKQTPTGNALNVQIGPGDIISNIPVFMDFDHHQLHEGETYRWSVLVPAAANTNTKYIKFVVPNITIPVGVNPVTLCPHFRFEVVADAAGDITFYEGSSFTGDGTQRTPIAEERNGTYTPKLQVWEDPTTPTLGTAIWRGMVTGSKQTGGGIDNGANEFVLKNNTTYCMTFTPAANSTKYLMRFVWYEDLGV